MVKMITSQLMFVQLIRHRAGGLMLLLWKTIFIVDLKTKPWKTSVLKSNNNTISKVLYPYEDNTRDLQSNISLRMKEFPRAKPKGSPKGKGVYLTVYPEWSPIMDSIKF